MNLEINSFDDVKVVRLKEARLIFPLLSAFSAQVFMLIERGARKLVIDLSDVGYLDCASYGCLMDIYRMMSERGGTVKMVGLQNRVETMANMVGMTSLIEVFREQESALNSF